MARLTVTVTVSVLLFLFTFSYARTPLEPETEVVDRDLSISQPESDTKPTILLPSQKAESDPTTVFELEPVDTDTQPVESADDLPEFDTVTVDALSRTRPSTIVSFRPINRHFRVNGRIPIRVPLRRCRHHIKPMNPRFHGREVSYGNDMILSSENSDVDPAVVHGGVRQIPARWVRLYHHHHHRHHDDGMPRFSFRHHDMFAKEKLKRPFRHEEHEVEEEERESKGKEGGEREEGGFMKGIRKFLNHF